MTHKIITKEGYRQRIERVIEYIHDHLDGELSLDVLADVACLSPYHWHRIYRSITSESLSKTVRRLRLQRAAKQLAQHAMSIEGIAKQAGYTNTDSFSRKFSRDYGMTPIAYRQRGQYIMQTLNEPTESNGLMYDVEIQALSDIVLVTIDHQGDYLGISRAFEKLFAWCGRHGLLNQATRCFGVYLDDPKVVPKDQLTSKAGFTVDVDIPVDDAIKKYTISSGQYARIIHKGPYSELETAYRWLYASWLLESGEEPDDQPVIEEYLNDPTKTLPSELLTAIYLPIKCRQ